MDFNIMGQRNSKKKIVPQRRKIIEWLGLGALGALIFRIVPMKRTISKKIMRGNNRKISIFINKDAVKRSGKVTKNG